MNRAVNLIILLLGICSGCVGSGVHSTVTYNQVKKTIKNNNAALMKLRAGMNQEEVGVILGDPARCEGYPWGSAWLYRTAMTSGIRGSIYGTIDSDFTPVMFDNKGVLLGWGRNYYKQYTKEYEVTIKQEE